MERCEFSPPPPSPGPCTLPCPPGSEAHGAPGHAELLGGGGWGDASPCHGPGLDTPPPPFPDRPWASPPPATPLSAPSLSPLANPKH